MSLNNSSSHFLIPCVRYWELLELEKKYKWMCSHMNKMDLYPAGAFYFVAGEREGNVDELIKKEMIAQKE